MTGEKRPRRNQLGNIFTLPVGCKLPLKIQMQSVFEQDTRDGCKMRLGSSTRDHAKMDVLDVNHLCPDSIQRRCVRLDAFWVRQPSRPWFSLRVCSVVTA